MIVVLLGLGESSHPPFSGIIPYFNHWTLSLRKILHDDCRPAGLGRIRPPSLFGDNTIF